MAKSGFSFYLLKMGSIDTIRLKALSFEGSFGENEGHIYIGVRENPAKS